MNVARTVRHKDQAAEDGGVLEELGPLLRRRRSLLLPEAVSADGGRDERPGQHERGQPGQDPDRERRSGCDLDRRVRTDDEERVARQCWGERSDPLEERPGDDGTGSGVTQDVDPTADEDPREQDAGPSVDQSHRSLLGSSMAVRCGHRPRQAIGSAIAWRGSGQLYSPDRLTKPRTSPSPTEGWTRRRDAMRLSRRPVCCGLTTSRRKPSAEE